MRCRLGINITTTLPQTVVTQINAGRTTTVGEPFTIDDLNPIVACMLVVAQEQKSRTRILLSQEPYGKFL